MDLLIKNVDYPVEPSENKIFYPCTMCIQPNGSIYITINDEVGAFLTVIILIIAIIDVSHGIIIDDKINLYESENNKIDKQVYSIVENYKDYEKGTFESLKNKNADTLITLYPELKSDTLVKEQIKIYNSNRKEIIKLKQEKLEQKPLRWWLYFGG